MESTARSLRECMEDHVRRTSDLIGKTDYDGVAKLIEKLLEAYRKGSRIFIFGNGGSAACASHFAEDLAKGAIPEASRREKRLRVLSLTDCTPFLTALGNDCGYETVFREQLATNAAPGDIAIGISGSGNSPNVLNAITWANENGLYTVGLTGFDGGKLKRMVNLDIHSPVPDMEIAENAHLVLVHLVVSGLRRALSG
jgi:D-sedoheptulose 7-phosphate isomerase